MADNTTTVTVGETEVEIRETDDGFEARAVEQRRDVPHVRFESSGHTAHGGEVPIDADYVVEPDPDDDGFLVAWHSDDDVDGEMEKTGYRGAEQSGYDSYAWVQNFELTT